MRIQSFLLVTVITLVGWWLLLPAVNDLKLPVRETYGIISHAVETGRSPSTNIAIYLLLLLVPNLLIIGFVALQDRLKGLIRLPNSAKLSNFFTEKRTIPLIVSLLLIVWTLNATAPNASSTATFPKDGFHFGEKIGLTSAYLQSPKRFFDQDYMLIHGFGLNVLPGVVGRMLGGRDLNIAFTIYAVYLQSLLAIAFSFLILYEAAIFISPQHRWKTLLCLSLIYFALHGTTFGLIDRDLLFALQAYLSLRWLRLQNSADLERNPQPRFKLLLSPFLVAFTIPLSIIYVYDRASYFIVLWGCLLAYCLITTPRKHMFRILVSTLTGVLTAALLLSVSLGANVLPSAISQIHYWSKVSGLFTGLPYPKINVSVGSLIDWVNIFLQSITLTLLCLQLREHLISGKKLRVFLKENDLPIFLLVCAVLFMRVALGRSDGGHLISPGFFAVFAFTALMGRNLAKQQILRVSWQNLTLATFIAASLFNMNAVFAAVNLKQLAQYPDTIHALLTQTNATLLAPDQQLVAKNLQNRMKSQSCFYTLTSEGLWYELLDKPPCSRYWYLIYATSPDTQKQVVRDLEKTKPRLILYSGGFGDVLDGVPKEVSHLRVHQYIWKHYRPYRRIQNRWFWIRRNSQTTWEKLLVPQPNLASGYFDGIIAPVKPSNLFSAGGWSIAPNLPSSNPQPQNQNKPPEKSVILLTVNSVIQPDQLIPINVGETSQERPDVAALLGLPNSLAGWAVFFNQLNLPNGKFEAKAWVYNSADHKFYQLPQSHNFEVKH
jgi:hypothetical protein